ncbi:pyridoxamine 5'-phosphate oxidase family protein (plasmid) [Roseibium aggregatum]|uniref:pyridoxamine 5'-phosphate oxidase family protein n=1 Tax=Roseibium aggregatum TaxID=187304 RepID=UPI001E426DF1|nr:pyridoxamine 5'-phosphate oxidase family protein [Roseibium aggregatum]UES60066.1 pyridoxamine 5'-phosphate oxidase family protein [Roseibium aggregatum]
MGIAHSLNPALRAFIERQKMFFVATADVGGRVNVSPKGMDTIRVLDGQTIRWLNLSGSGNETAAHVQATGRMTLMFCAFEGPAMILRVYGTTKVRHPRDADWHEVLSDFPVIAGSRQIFDLSIEMVQTSCGTGVPFMAFQSCRADDELVPFYQDMGEDGVRDYWRRKNMETIDGMPTGIFDDD